ncbi:MULTISPECIES: substrate-binding periplasmic protein [Alkalimonas]|uniref:Transporter substrate-binding domain-containing protein n=1 Tax=Alkalimonas mucilaginosa TaxID=3057676 RepID=A0ABU7JD32_9GAMM|nr:transporter substrate-binding domain-containing protein [Alkalimonas sp. MEB004]MEE2023512.1 transporter substrate-binding domain-containing protein [Alkalimonas sp. MEB004]
MSILTLLFALPCLVIGNYAVAGNEASELIIKTMLQDSAPKYIEQADGSYTGLAIDIMQALERADGTLAFQFDRLNTPFPRIVHELQHNRIDAFVGAIYTDERAELFDYLEPALYSTQNRLLVRQQDASLVIGSLKDVVAMGRDAVILVDRGTAHHNWLQSIPGLRIDGGANTREQNLLKLLSERGRFYYSTDLGVLHTARAMGIEQQIHFLPLVLKEEPQYLVVAKALPIEARQRLQQALEHIYASGELAQIRARYFYD